MDALCKTWYIHLDLVNAPLLEKKNHLRKDAFVLSLVEIGPVVLE